MSFTQAFPEVSVAIAYPFFLYCMYRPLPWLSTKERKNAVYLDKKNIRILRCFIKSQNILTLDQLIVLTHYDYDDIVECLVFLWKRNLIRIVDYDQPKYLPEDGEFQITMEGKLHLKQVPRNIILTWAPLTISVIAIIISIIALIY